MSADGVAAIVLAGVLSVAVVEVLARVLDLRALGRPLSGEAGRLFGAEWKHRADDYARRRSRLSIVGVVGDLVVLLLFWFAGGFGKLDELVRSLGGGPVVTGLLYIGILVVARALLELPLRAYGVFAIEARFGFNRTSPALFAFDALKGLVMLGVLGGPLVAGFLVLFEYGGDWAWVFVWGAAGGLALVMQVVMPAVIMPWFNTFTPLEDGPLTDEIGRLAERAGFPVRAVTVMDGSRRTTKANAFFVGIGRRRRIALYDTLLHRYGRAQILGVLAHEIGHYRLGHIRQGLIVSLAEAGVLLFLFARLGEAPALARAFGVEQSSVYAGLVFFFVAVRPLSLVFAIGQLALSRRNERAADVFAVGLVGEIGGLAGALVQLYRESLGELAPHPLLLALTYSHPPLPERLRALALARRASRAA